MTEQCAREDILDGICVRCKRPGVGSFEKQRATALCIVLNPTLLFSTAPNVVHKRALQTYMSVE